MAIRLGKRAGETLRGAGALSSVGLAFVLALVIGAWLGSVLDRWAGTSPLFFILFFFFGLTAGILNVYRAVSAAMPPSSPPAGADSAQGGPPQAGPRSVADTEADSDATPLTGHDGTPGPAGPPSR